MAKNKKRANNSGPLKVRQMKPEEVRMAQQVMTNLAESAAGIIGINKAALGNIFGDDALAVPSSRPLLEMAATTPLYIALAEVGSASIAVIEQITDEINLLADPEIDRYIASAKIAAILRLIGKKLPKLLGKISYGMTSSKSQKHGYDKIVTGVTSGRNAGAFQKFAALLPKSFRQACIVTAKSSKRVCGLAKKQDEQATRIQGNINSAFAKDLLPVYAKTIAKNADAIPGLAQRRTALRTQLGKEAKSDRPNSSLKESDMLKATNALVDAMIALQRAREQYYLRAGALAVSSEGVVAARTIQQNTGAKALEHVDQLGFMLIVHFFRMLTLSLLALSVALGFIDRQAVYDYWDLAQAEDNMTAQALAGGSFKTIGG